MRGTFKVTNNLQERTVRIRMSGDFDRETMARFIAEIKRVQAEYDGRSHVMLADMRGMGPLDMEMAEALGSIIAYSREHGVVCCAHISDDAVQRLQAARLGRQSSPHDDSTIDVVSLEEAERVLGEARIKLP